MILTSSLFGAMHFWILIPSTGTLTLHYGLEPNEPLPSSLPANLIRKEYDLSIRCPSTSIILSAGDISVSPVLVISIQTFQCKSMKECTTNHSPFCVEIIQWKGIHHQVPWHCNGQKHVDCLYMPCQDAIQISVPYTFFSILDPMDMQSGEICNRPMIIQPYYANCQP